MKKVLTVVALIVVAVVTLGCRHTKTAEPNDPNAAEVAKALGDTNSQR